MISHTERTPRTHYSTPAPYAPGYSPNRPTLPQRTLPQRTPNMRLIYQSPAGRGGDGEYSLLKLRRGIGAGC